MRADGQTVSGNELAIQALDLLESLKAWAKATFSKERMAGVGVVVATLVVAGYLGTVLFKGIQIYSMSGF